MKITNPRWDKIKAHLPRNKAAFFFAVFFVCYGFWNISDVLWIRCILAGFGFYAEYEAQWIWAYAMALKKVNKAYVQWVILNLVYVFIFALPSGIGFFATEIATQDAQTQKIVQTDANRQNRIDELHALIKTQNELMSAEVLKRGGAGPIYEGMKATLDGYNTELRTLSDSPKTKVIIEKNLKRNMFINVQDLSGIPRVWIIAVMCSAGLSMVYVGLWKKPMIVKLEEEETEGISEGQNELEKLQELREDIQKWYSAAKEEGEKRGEAALAEQEKPAEDRKLHLVKNDSEITWKYPEISRPATPAEFTESVLTKPVNLIPASEEKEEIEESAGLEIAPVLKPNDKQLFLKFLDELYRDIDDSNIGSDGIELNSSVQIKNNSKGKISRYITKCYVEYLEQIGAVKNEMGKVPVGYWPKSKIIEYAKGES